MGDMIIVLDANWQVKWYFDTFEHAGGPPQLDLMRPAVLGETCVSGQTGCPPIFLLSSGTAPAAYDWLHANALYYWPQSKDIIWSSRHQDWVMKVDYNDGMGSGNILWRMGPEGDFSMTNIFADPWPWFSHQHEVAIENTGVMTLLDNGNTRVSPPTGPNSSTGGLLGLGTACGPFDCDSRGMALNFNETSMQVTPAVSVDLGQFSTAMGSAQLLSNGNYFFVASIVVEASGVDSYDIEVTPTPATDAGHQVLNMGGSEVYRDWLMPSLYAPPLT
jgi:arylsulfate sulfotransferase